MWGEQRVLGTRESLYVGRTEGSGDTREFVCGENRERESLQDN